MSFADYLTLLRLILVPFFLVAFLKGNYFLAFVLFTVAGVTDLVDGSIARLLKRQTRFGAVLDPIADKALMMTTVVCLLILKIIPLWFCLLVLVRDTMILSGLALLKIKKIIVDLKPVLASKLGTLSNIAMVVFGFWGYLRPWSSFLRFPLQYWFHFFLGVSTIFILISGWQYVRLGLKHLRT